jgi:hypothetical protein
VPGQYPRSHIRTNPSDRSLTCSTLARAYPSARCPHLLLRSPSRVFIQRALAFLPQPLGQRVVSFVGTRQRLRPHVRTPLRFLAWGRVSLTCGGWGFPVLVTGSYAPPRLSTKSLMMLSRLIPHDFNQTTAPSIDRAMSTVNPMSHHAGPIPELRCLGLLGVARTSWAAASRTCAVLFGVPPASSSVPKGAAAGSVASTLLPA